MEYKTRAITITVRPDHILEITSNEDWNETDTVEVAKENIDKMREVVGDKKGMAILVVIPSTYTSKEVLTYYYNADVGEVARAFLITSFAAKVVGNLYLSIMGRGSTTGKPTKLFSEKEKAIDWLKEQIENYNKK